MATPDALLFASVQWRSAGPLLLTSLAIMGSPGPATLSLVAAASAYGVRRSLPYLLGVISGASIVLVAVATGITAALLALPAISTILIGISATYILWLAYHIATAPLLSVQTEASDAPSLAGGVLLGIANPKAWVAIPAVFASAHLADAAIVDAAAKTAVLTAMIMVIHSAWLVTGTSLALVLRDRRRARVANTALAAVLIGATALAVLR